MELDLYDFSDISYNLNYMTLDPVTDGLFTCFTPSTGGCDCDDDEEWYPPTPPVYDVAEKLVEVNRLFLEDPTPVDHEPGRVTWPPGSSLVQIKWLFKDCSPPRSTENKLIFEADSFSTDSERISAHENDENRTVETPPEKVQELTDILQKEISVGPETNSIELDFSYRLETPSPHDIIIDLVSYSDDENKIILEDIDYEDIKEELSDSKNYFLIETIEEDLQKLSISPTPGQDSVTVSMPLSESPNQPTNTPNIDIPASPNEDSPRSDSDTIDYLTQKQSSDSTSSQDSPCSHVSSPKSPDQYEDDFHSPDEKESESETSQSDSGNVSNHQSTNSLGLNSNFLLEQVALMETNNNNNLISTSNYSNNRPRKNGSINANTHQFTRLRPGTRKASSQSTSSTSSISSQTTDETSVSTFASRQRWQTQQQESDSKVMTREEAVSKWKLRKREEKRLKERKAFIEAQMMRRTSRSSKRK